MIYCFKTFWFVTNHKSNSHTTQQPKTKFYVCKYKHVKPKNHRTEINCKKLEDVLSKKPTFLLRPIKDKTLIKINKFESAHKDYKPKKIAYAFNDRYIEYKNEGSGKLSLNNILKQLNRIWVI